MNKRVARAKAKTPKRRSRPLGRAASKELRLLNRELSWLDFNERVLELVADPEIPLLERIRFCAIFSANLDEFFMVRVAALQESSVSGLGVRSPDGRTPVQALEQIRLQVADLLERLFKVWSADLQPSLQAAGIFVGSIADCTPQEQAELGSLFERHIFPILTPLAVGPGQPFPYISGLSLSLGVEVRDPDTGEERFARVKVPEVLPRFQSVGDRGLLVAMEDIIAHFLPQLFSGMEILETAAFRVTRDADFEVSDEADDLLEAVEGELRRRRFGDVVRLEVADDMSDQMLDGIKAGVGAGDEQVFCVHGPLDLADLEELTTINRPELRYDPWAPVTQARLSKLRAASLFAEIRSRDILVHLPYDSFGTSVESFVRSAAKDPNVIALKATVYRTSDESPLVPALVEAADEGKQSVCLVEIKARFDERRNIEWSRRLEQAGVHVVYGFPHLKVHAKAVLVVRREGGSLHRYVHIGTGNYHSLTARSYEDLGLFTDDEAITADIAEFFNHVTGFGSPRPFRKILVAPFELRNRLIEEIRKCADSARKGKIFIKVNALTDPTLIGELYKASSKGVRIEIIARSICTLRPKVPGLSESIRVRSILGRFLEHSRLFVFQAGANTSYFMGSADLMPRNLDQRVEVVVPIEDPKIQHDLMSFFDLWLRDRSHAWELEANGNWKRLRAGPNDRKASSQEIMMRRARARRARNTSAKASD